MSAQGTHLTYAQLNARANRLARRLITAGSGPDRLVGLALPRSAELIVALLAVLKSGAAYLPLDPALPADRTRYILDDAQPVCVLTATATATDRLRQTPYPVLLTDGTGDPDGTGDLDDTGGTGGTGGTDGSDDTSASGTPAGDSDTADVTDTERRAPLSAAHLAYVIYTSGSTGRPKGMEIAHRQVVRLLTTTEAEFGFGPDDVWSLFHSYAFDFSVWEIWGALAYGGTLAVVPVHIARSPGDFVTFLHTHRVTVLNRHPQPSGS